jgi:predicted transposase YbfD/YdcC
MMCGKTSMKAIARFAKAHRNELAKYIPLPRQQTPSYSTIQRTNERLNPNEVCDSFNRWMSQYPTSEPIAADGKSITSTVTNSNTNEQKFTSLVSFFGQVTQLIYRVGFLENDKCSEIQVLQKMISKMQITKTIFTMDALHCQKKTVQAVVDSGNDYVITVKKNQPTLHKAIADKADTKPIDSFSWEQKGHGHDSKCRIKIWEADENMKQKWKGLECYISVRRQGIRDGKRFDTTTFYISSANLSAWRFAKVIRGHRKIENNLHWTKDVVQNEDSCGLVKPEAAVNMGVMRDISFNLLVMNGFKSISDGISAMGEKVSNLWSIVSSGAKKLCSMFG